MESIKEIYKVGNGPSSSHTMGPKKAAGQFVKRVPKAARYKVTLLGTLAATGKGHLTDVAIQEVFAPKPLEIDWKPSVYLPRHPNALTFEAFDAKGSIIDTWTAYSIGGGSVVDDETTIETKQVYEYSSMQQIMDWCGQQGKQFWEYVEQNEGKEIWDFLAEIWKAMKDAIKRGLATEGSLPGALTLPRKAPRWA
jgi:L-serine dehydratase